MSEKNLGRTFTPESLDYIKQNCQLSAEALQNTLSVTFGVQPALQTIRNQLTKFRKEARLESAAISAEVDRQIELKVQASCDEYWDILDSKIRRANSILDGEDSIYKCEWKDGNPSLREWRSTARLLNEYIQTAFSVRPEPKDLSVVLSGNDELKDRIDKYESLFKKESDGDD